MKNHRDRDPSAAARTPESEPGKSRLESGPRKRHSRWRKVGLVVGIFIVLLGTGRAIMPWAVRDYVNRTLDRNPVYSGTIGKVHVHIWRGAYSIQDIQISKVTANVPVPFFAARQVDFAVQWNALFHGKIVGQVVMDEPQINFVDAPDEADKQTGSEGAWLQMITDLFPFKINSAIVHNGSVHLRMYATEKPMDVYLSQVAGSISDLTNIRDVTNPLVSTVQATGLVMDQAKFDFKMTLDPFSYLPTFHLALRLLGLDVTKINDLALAYGKFDFKRGWFDLVVEAEAKAGLITGYVKPLFRDLKLLSPAQDLAGGNVLKFFWQALLGGVTSVLKNQPRDQFGTLVPFTGNVTQGSSPDILATIGNLLRNAFVRAYLPKLQGGAESVEGLNFEAPDITAPVSPAGGGTS